MKKILTFCILILLVPGLFGFTAHAYAYQPVKAEIEVEVTLGGTAAIIPNVNCPIPEKTELTLKDGEIGKFDIEFTEVGVFDYTVKTVPDDRDIEFDDTVYNIKFYVTDNDGRLEATVIASKGEEKYNRLIFVNTEKGGDEPTTNPTDSSDNGGSPKQKSQDKRRYQNGDILSVRHNRVRRIACAVDSVSYRHAENDKQEKQRRKLAP